MRRATACVITAVLLTSAMWVFQTEPARACSCEETTTASIDRADGAVIGTVVDIDDIADRWPEQDEFVATVDVLIDIKGNVAEQVFIDWYMDDGGNCGTQWRAGQEIGVLLTQDEDGRLRGGGCEEFTRDLAEQYSAPLSIGGQADVVISGDNGSYRTVAYDAKGNPIAYGFEPGMVSLVDLCDDGATLLELIIDWQNETQAIAVRSLATFEIVTQWPVVSDEGLFGVQSIHCEGIAGSSATISAKEPLERQDIFGTYRVDKSGVTPIDEPYLGEPFTPSGDFWPVVRTSSGTIQAQDWMQRLVRLEKPVFVEPGEGLKLKQISQGVSANPDDAGQATDPIATTSDDGGSASSSGISLGILATIFAGAALIVLAMYLFLNSDRRRT